MIRRATWWPSTRTTAAIQPSGGDGKFYFRVDFEDLLAYAEQGNLDVYVAINFGNPGTGEYNLPDNLRTGTQDGLAGGGGLLPEQQRQRLSLEPDLMPRIRRRSART